LIEFFAAQLQTDPAILKPCVLEHLVKCRWDGNVRELKNVVEGLLMHGDDGIMDWRALPVEETITGKASLSQKRSLLEESEREQIRKIYLECGKKIKPTAKMLGIDRNTLRVKLVKYGIQSK
jgi:sigma-54 dependent transcriptional regulator, acetoin dehydrogenase operon transcriptional activator AcoR